MAKTILVVDDDKAVLESYGRLLRRLGHRVLLSEDSEGVRTDPDSLRGVDLLILDQRMPRTSGLALLDSLRRRMSVARDEDGGRAGIVPAVILISAFLSDEIRDEATRLGVVQVIEKPVDAARLLALVRAALDGPQPVPHP
jgi:CheY-like chemotaxis protein